MALGPDFRSVAVQAILGPYHSGLVPDVLHIGWIDALGELVAMSGATVTHDAFGPSGDGVVNIAPIDAGVAGEGWDVDAVGLFADPEGETLVIAATLDAPVLTEGGEPMAFEVGALQFFVSGEGEGSA